MGCRRDIVPGKPFWCFQRVCSLKTGEGARHYIRLEQVYALSTWAPVSLRNTHTHTHTHVDLCVIFHCCRVRRERGREVETEERSGRSSRLSRCPPLSPPGVMVSRRALLLLGVLLLAGVSLQQKSPARKKPLKKGECTHVWRLGDFVSSGPMHQTFAFFILYM